MYHGNHPLICQTVQIHLIPLRVHIRLCFRLYLDHRNQPKCQSFHRHPVNDMHRYQNVLLDHQLYVMVHLHLLNYYYWDLVILRKFLDNLIDPVFWFVVLPVQVRQSIKMCKLLMKKDFIQFGK